jgi:chemotaxis protein methyltransferase CheR
MTDAECVEFLQAALPLLGLRWPGFRRVRRLVCKRLGKRLRELGIPDLPSYRSYLQNHPGEWRALDEFCRIPISRFYRDCGVFENLEREVLPVLAGSAAARGRSEIACWSACCASGEEAHTVALLWRLRVQQRFPRIRLRVVATDIDSRLLERARTGCYEKSSLKALPPDFLAGAFAQRGAQFCVRDELRTIEFLQQDIRQAAPQGEFDLVLCRNAVLTYFAPLPQREVMERIVARLRPGGALAVGIHESLPDGLGGLAPWPGARAIYRKAGPVAA